MKIDYDAVALEVAADRRARVTDPQYRAKQWLKALVPNAVVYMLIIPLIVGEGRLYALSSPQLWFWLGGTVLASAVSVALSDRSYRGASVYADQPARALEQNISMYTGDGWMYRTTKMGIYLGLGVGIPVGLAMALLLPADYGVGFDRWIEAVVFVGLTLVWSVPMAFAIRWISLRAVRRYTVS